MVEQSAWMQEVAADPGRSSWYVERFRAMAAAGHDLAGEARLIDAMAGRRSRILDAGCGPGRVGAALARLGHDVVGVDVDPVLIAAALEDHPGPRWIVGDLAEFDLPALGVPAVRCHRVCRERDDVPRAEHPRRGAAAVPGARARRGAGAVGFGAGRGYEFSAFLTDAHEAGLEPDLLLSTWELRPWQEDSDFLVALLRPYLDTAEQSVEV